VSQGRKPGIVSSIDDIRGMLGFMAQSVTEGARYRWNCVGCRARPPLDLAEWLGRCGPRYSMLNQIDVCSRCGAPCYLIVSRGASTPFLPMKVEWLWIVREINNDPDAWWQIQFME